MSLNQFWDWIQDSELAFQIGATWLFPLLESIHVLGVAFLLGSILVVDLRLLGLTAISYTFSRLERELTYWTWGAFVITVVTGIGMFISRPGAYAENPAFQVKLIFLLLAGVNLIVFKRLVYSTVEQWDDSPIIPLRARLSGLFSLALWAGVILAGRWVGHIM